MNTVEDDLQSITKEANDNIDLFIEKATQLDVLENKASKIQFESENFLKKSRKFKRKIVWDRMKSYILLVIFAVVIFYLIQRAYLQ